MLKEKTHVFYYFKGVLDPPKQGTVITVEGSPDNEEIMAETSSSSTQRQGDSDPGARTLTLTGFKHLFARYSAEKRTRPSEGSQDDTEESLKNAEILRQMLDYLEMPIKPVIDEKGNAIKVDQIAFWQDHSGRFPDLVSLALTMVAIGET